MVSSGVHITYQFSSLAGSAGELVNTSASSFVAHRLVESGFWRDLLTLWEVHGYFKKIKACQLFSQSSRVATLVLFCTWSANSRLLPAVPSVVRATLVRHLSASCLTQTCFVSESSFIELAAEKGFSQVSLEMSKSAQCPRANGKLKYEEKLKLLGVGSDAPEKEHFRGGVGRPAALVVSAVAVWRMLASGAHWWPLGPLGVCFPGGPAPLRPLLSPLQTGQCHDLWVFLHFFCRSVLQNQARQRHVCLVKFSRYKAFSQFQPWSKLVICKGCSRLESSLGGILK